MSKHLAKVNTKSEVLEATKNLEEPFIIAIDDTKEVIYQSVTHCDATLLIDDWNNANSEIPVIEKDISWVKGRRCLAKQYGNNQVAICYLDNNNSELFHDGVTEAKLDGSMGQWMVDLPEFNIDCTQGEKDWVKLHISQSNEIGHKSRRVLVGVTKAYREGEVAYSKYGNVPQTGTLEYFSYGASQIGNGWSIIDYETRCKITYMFLTKYHVKNPQALSKFKTNQSATAISGETKSLGNQDGVTENHINIFGIEDPYGAIWEWTGGINSYCKDNVITYYIYDGVQPFQIPTVKYRMVTDDKLGVIKDQEQIYKYGCVSRMKYGEYADLIPIECSGSYNYFYNDYATVGYDDWSIIKCGGYGTMLDGGIFSFAADDNRYSSGDGSRIQYRGDILVIEDPQDFINIK